MDKNLKEVLTDSTAAGAVVLLDAARPDGAIVDPVAVIAVGTLQNSGQLVPCPSKHGERKAEQESGERGPD